MIFIIWDEKGLRYLGIGFRILFNIQLTGIGMYLLLMFFHDLMYEDHNIQGNFRAWGD